MRIVAPSVEKTPKAGVVGSQKLENADTDVAVLGPCCRLLGAEGVVVEQGQRRLERLQRADAVVAHAVRVLVGHVLDAQEVAAPQLDGIDGHLAGGDVEHDLPGERLVLPWPPVAGTARGVGVDGPQPEPGGGYPIRPGEDGADGHGGHRRPRRRVRPGVGHEIEVDGLDQPLVVEAHADVGVLVAGPARGRQVLLTILDPLDRHRQLRGGEHDRHLFALDEDLLPEAAAGVPGDRPDPVLGDPEQARRRTLGARAVPASPPTW